MLQSNLKAVVSMLILLTLAACGGGGGGGDDTPLAVTTPPANNNTNDGGAATEADDPTGLDADLLALTEAAGLIGNASFNRTVPSIEDPLPQLGRALFFSKSLSGEFDVACVSCHHPTLGGADALTLPVGVGSNTPELLGPGRVHEADGIPNVPRNSPTVFNIAIWDSGLFFDSRVESFGKEEFANGSVSDIRTPDVDFGNADPNAGLNLAAAQARFPVTSFEEMRGTQFESGNDNNAVRDHLAARLGGYGIGAGELSNNEWLAAFQAGLETSSDAETIVTADNVALALGAYQRSMMFTNNPFSDYLAGDMEALTEQQKRGAILFFTPAEQGGGHCSQCHAGDKFTDELHHTVAFPQIGHGKGDGVSDDFGRERETNAPDDRYRFRTPSLLNIAQTAPYGHTGAYASLNEVLQHYNNPRGTVDDFFEEGGVCGLDQFEDINNCDNLYPQAQSNSDLALDKLAQERTEGTTLFVDIDLNNGERADIVAFLGSLTDPCIMDRACLAPWIPEAGTGGPDGNQLDAVDNSGDLL